MVSDSSENTTKHYGTDSRVYFDLGDVRVDCIKDGIVVKCAILPTFEEAERYAKCWREGLEYVYV